MTSSADDSRPTVGICAYPRVVEIVPAPTLLHTANRHYVDAVARAGAVPVILPVLDPVLAPVAVSAVDALLLAGGGDVAPAAYGEAPRAETAGVDESRDAWEIALTRAAAAARVPLLATCRGAQVVNVACGGTLVQHLPAVSELRHGWAARHGEFVHDVRVDASSRLAALVGCSVFGVNSLHHQAVDDCGHDVRAVAWAGDGTVEAFEVDGHPEVLAVQWHPELLPDDDRSHALFGWLVGEARACRRRRFST